MDVLGKVVLRDSIGYNVTSSIINKLQTIGIIWIGRYHMWGNIELVIRKLAADVV